MMTRRKYRMMRIATGDYLLPSNDRNTLWRIYRYHEDGSLEGWEGDVWACAKFNGDLKRLPEDPTDWEYWDFWCGPMRSRREAIEDVIR